MKTTRDIILDLEKLRFDKTEEGIKIKNNYKSKEWLAKDRVNAVLEEYEIFDFLHGSTLEEFKEKLYSNSNIEIDNDEWDNPNVKTRIVTKEMYKYESY